LETINFQKSALSAKNDLMKKQLEKLIKNIVVRELKNKRSILNENNADLCTREIKRKISEIAAKSFFNFTGLFNPTSDM
jgi:hypothetical protein